MPTYIEVVCVLNSLLPLSAVNALWVLFYMLFLPIEKIHYTLCSFICYNNALPFERKPPLEQTFTNFSTAGMQHGHVEILRTAVGKLTRGKAVIVS